MTGIGPRYPISVRISGVLLHEKTKLYMAQVMWSDQNEIAVYRSIDEFMTIHKRMKKIFPPSSPLKKSDRTIPKFKDVKMKGNVKKKGPSRSVQRCKFLEKYCNDLLSCDPQVTQNSELTKFFHPKEQDLQQDFIKKCIMIVASEQLEGGGGGGHNHLNQAAHITQPFVTGTYRCVAPFETKDTKNRAFKVAVDEKLEVLIKDQKGWWLVENESKNMAWFPAPYLEKVLDDDDDEFEEDDDIDGPYERGAEYIAVRGYKATKGDELSVEIGHRVEVLQRSDNGWWLVRHKGKGGYVPALYLQPYTNPLRSPTPNISLQHSRSLEAESSSPRISPIIQHSHSLDVAPARSRSISPHTLDVAPPARSHSALPHTLDVAPSARSRSVSPLQHSPSLEVNRPTRVPAVRFVDSPSELQLPEIQRPRSPRAGDIASDVAQQQLQLRFEASLPVGASTPMLGRAHPPTPPPVSPTTPVITVEGAAERAETDGRDRTQGDSEDSFGSDSSEFSIDGLSSSSAGSGFNLSQTDDQQQQQQQQQLRLAYTPPAPTGRQSSSNYLSPNLGAALMPATSDPSLYKRATSPRVPPRPKDKEILTRCSTITRKNLARAQSPAQISTR